jgi:hypothetical protein
MNDQGLCFDVAGLPDHPINTGGKSAKDLMGYLLKDCATLQDAIDFFKDYYWVGHQVNHLMVMDRTGASAVIEHVGSTLSIYHKLGHSQVMTNYCFTDPDIRYGEYPCPRFGTASNMLDTMALTVNNMQKVCEEVSHAYYSALYGNIFNPTTLEVHIFNPNVHSSITTFNLVEEMNKGSHHYILKDHQILSSNEVFFYNDFSVSPNFPNPFSTTTAFTLELKTPSEIEIKVFDINGQLVKTLGSGRKIPGSYFYEWFTGSQPAGLYFCLIRIDGIIETRKWIKSD